MHICVHTSCSFSYKKPFSLHAVMEEEYENAEAIENDIRVTYSFFISP